MNAAIDNALHATDVISDRYNIRYLQKEGVLPATGQQGAPTIKKTADKITVGLQDIAQFKHYAGLLADGTARKAFSPEDRNELMQPIITYCGDRILSHGELIHVEILRTQDVMFPGLSGETNEALELAIFRAGKSENEQTRMHAKGALFMFGMMEVVNTSQDDNAVLEAHEKLNLWDEERDAAIEEYYVEAEKKYGPKCQNN